MINHPRTSHDINLNNSSDQLIEIEELTREIYFDGMGEVRVGCDDILANLMLLRSRIIDAFVVEWVEYYDIEFFQIVIDALKAYSHRMLWKDKLKLHPTKYGLLVTNYEQWIMYDMCLEICKDVDQYMISQISAENLLSVLAPVSLLQYLPHYTKTKTGKDEIRGDRYAIYLRDHKNDHAPIILRKFNDTYKDYAIRTCKEFIKHLDPNRFELCVVDILMKTSMCGKFKPKKYKWSELFKPDFDVDNYLNTINEECEQLYENNNIDKKIFAMVC